jgi:hypothetical protein
METIVVGIIALKNLLVIALIAWASHNFLWRHSESTGEHDQAQQRGGQ